ncbi:MAG: hypothetical protein Q7S40_02005 [Opitutaceae bacterium]|nr:hypothetical protein [Opitutaceae bacterium]
MNETSATTGVVVTPVSRCEYTAAFLLLRLFLGLRTLIEAIHKFESSGTYSTANYTKNMTRMAEGITGASFLPLWATKPYALVLGYVLAILGTALLLGVKTRTTLILSGLVYLSLSFGLMTVQESEGVAWLGMYVLMFVVALVLVRNDRFSVWPDKFN